MALLAWKTRNSSNYGVGDTKPIGEMLLDISGVALSDPNLSWVPTPINSIYHIGYHAATDNVQEGQGYYENTVIGNYNTSYQISYTKLQSEPWWGSQTTAETWATAYYQSGGGLGAGNRDVLFAYSYSVELNRLYGVFVNAGGSQQSFVGGESFTPLAQTRGDYAVTYQMTREGGGGAGVQFWGTQNKTEGDFVVLANYVVGTFNLGEGLKDYPWDSKTIRSAENGLNSLGFYTNHTGGIIYTFISGKFGQPNSNTANMTIEIDDNGNVTDMSFSGDWTEDGNFNLTSSEGWSMGGYFDSLNLQFYGELNSTVAPVAEIFDGTTDVNYDMTGASFRSY